ncbi:hypothetical protein ACWPKO_23660 (plasmid) [Coraliomargarita sp. W4R53]
MPFAIAITGLLGVLALFQVALIFGAPLGAFAWGQPTSSAAGTAADWQCGVDPRLWARL